MVIRGAKAEARTNGWLKLEFQLEQGRKMRLMFEFLTNIHLEERSGWNQIWRRAMDDPRFKSVIEELTAWTRHLPLIGYIYAPYVPLMEIKMA